jgi:hypothetical protein
MLQFGSFTPANCLTALSLRSTQQTRGNHEYTDTRFLGWRLFEVCGRLAGCGMLGRWVRTVPQYWEQQGGGEDVLVTLLPTAKALR